MVKSIELPSGEVVSQYELIIPDGNFSWDEATKGFTRIPSNISIESRIYKAAKMMEWVRTQLGGHPIHISSWYRPPAINSSVGGSIKSRHLYGDGVDFYCTHIKPWTIYNKINREWDKGGLHAYKTFVHIDCRGYKARW